MVGSCIGVQRLQQGERGDTLRSRARLGQGGGAGVVVTAGVVTARRDDALGAVADCVGHNQG